MITETITRNESRQREKKKLITEIAVIVGLVVIFAVLLPLALSAFRLRLLGRFLSFAIVASFISHLTSQIEKNKNA